MEGISDGSLIVLALQLHKIIIQNNNTKIQGKAIGASDVLEYLNIVVREKKKHCLKP